MSSKKVFAVVFLFFLVGCATKNFVREQIAPVQSIADQAYNFATAASAEARTARVEAEKNKVEIAQVKGIAEEALHRASEAEKTSITQFRQIARLQDSQERAKKQLGGIQARTAEVAKNLILSQITVAQDEEFFSDISPKDFAQRIKGGSLLASFEAFAPTEKEAKEVGERFLSQAGQVLGGSVTTTATFKKDQYFGRPRGIKGLPDKGISVVVKKAPPKPLTKAIATP